MVDYTSAKTGDLVFTKSSGVISKLIRIFTDPIGVISGKYVPSHAAMIREDDGELFVYESTTSRGGVARTNAEIWFAEHAKESIRLVSMPVTGFREAISEALSRIEGVPYEHWADMPSIILDKNEKSASRLFCSEMCLYVYREAGIEWFMQNHDPSNTTPDELYDSALGVCSQVSRG